jgi:hypothetical protein
MARWVFVIGIAMVACGGGGSGSTADLPRVAATQAEDQACSRDAECTLVDDCCGCARAGAKTAVRVDRVEALSAAAQSECAGRTCPDLPSEHRSCQATAARCSGGRCIPAL